MLTQANPNYAQCCCPAFAAIGFNRLEVPLWYDLFLLIQYLLYLLE